MKPDLDDVRESVVLFTTRNFPEVSATSHFKLLPSELRDEVRVFSQLALSNVSSYLRLFLASTDQAKISVNAVFVAS